MDCFQPPFELFQCIQPLTLLFFDLQTRLRRLELHPPATDVEARLIAIDARLDKLERTVDELIARQRLLDSTLRVVDRAAR